MESTRTTGSEIRVSVDRDLMRAELLIPGGTEISATTLGGCTTALASAGVELTDPMRNKILAELEPRTGTTTQPFSITFEGLPPTHGEDGAILWDPLCDPRQLSTEKELAYGVDHYNRKSYLTVQRGQKLAQIVPPTSGQDGKNLAGKNLPAKPGNPFVIQIADSVSRSESGELKAAEKGVLEFDGVSLAISPSLHIKTFVDFHTGNIDFDGDVEIAHGIRDRFQVKSTGSVIVRGLIEAASLDVHGDLNAVGGMAAKEKGHLKINGHLNARYLDNVIAQVKRHVTIEREVINCELNVGGNVTVLGGGLLGGTACIGGSVSVQTLGAPSGDRTELAIASIPAIEQVLRQSNQACEQLENQVARIDSEIGQLKSQPLHSAANREKITELSFEKTEFARQLKNLTAKRDSLLNHIGHSCEANLAIHKTVEPGTILICHGMKVAFDQQVKGPLWIGWDIRNGGLVYRLGEHNPLNPISQIARVIAMS